MNMTILPVKRDVIFRIFFADERNIEHPTDKLGIVDVKLKTVSGKTIHIEIQVAPCPTRGNASLSTTPR